MFLVLNIFKKFHLSSLLSVNSHLQIYLFRNYRVFRNITESKIVMACIKHFLTVDTVRLVTSAVETRPTLLWPNFTAALFSMGKDPRGSQRKSKVPFQFGWKNLTPFLHNLGGGFKTRDSMGLRLSQTFDRRSGAIESTMQTSLDFESLRCVVLLFYLPHRRRLESCI